MSDATSFLYPFIESEESDPAALLADMAASARDKARISAQLQQRTVNDSDALLDSAAQALAQMYRAGGRMFVFGNGGSSTDAATMAALFATPPAGRPLSARSLTADEAVLTALANDVGFELIFSRQIIAHGRAGDCAVAMSTSGNSDDLMNGLIQAKKQGLITIGFAGYDGGEMLKHQAVDFCFVVDSQSVHRIQESQALVGYELWRRTQALMVQTVPQNSGGTDV